MCWYSLHSVASCAEAGRIGVRGYARDGGRKGCNEECCAHFDQMLCVLLLYENASRAQAPAAISFLPGHMCCG